MPSIDYIKIFRDSWNITKNNRFLWWFGFFLLMPGISNPDIFSFKEDSPKEWNEITDKFNLADFLITYERLISIVLVMVAILFVVFIVLSFVSQGAVVKATQRILKGEQTNFKISFRDGCHYFWKNIAVSFMLGFFALACMLSLGIPVAFLFFSESYILGTILAIPALLIFIPLIILFKYLQTFSNFYIVLAELKPWQAIENAYALFRKNILASIIMSLLFMVIGIVSFCVVMLIFLALFLVFGILAAILFLVLQKTGVIIAGIIGIIVFVFALIFLYSVYGVFSQVSWVLFFHIIATPKDKAGVSSIENIKKEDVSQLASAQETVKTAEVEK